MVATEFTDISPLYAGKAGRVIQVDPTEKGVEFGQALRVTDSPQFEGLNILASFVIECDAILNAGLLVEGDAIFSATVDVEGSLNVTDNKITLNNKGTPSDLNADGGGLLLLGDLGSPKTLSWLNATKAWAFNQDVAVQKRLSVGALTAPAADASIDLKATNKGLLFNRLTTVQRDALTAVQGMVIYNTTLDDMEFFTGSVWKSMNSALVTGPALSTDNAVVRYDGTSGKLTQNSGVTIDDAGNVVIPGDLTIQGTTVTLDSTTLLVEDKNIELGVVVVPTDITADGGGITLKGTTDKTIVWLNSTDAWTFNQGIDLLGNNLTTTGVVLTGDLIAITSALAGNLQLSGNTLSSINANGDINLTPNGTGKVVIDDLISVAGGVFKFTNDAVRAGLDAVEFVEIGHGGGNGFINAVGDGGLDIRFEGATLATFTDFGHLHLQTNVDQKHTLKIITANNLNDTGLAWENSGGAFTGTIFRTDIGSNRADLVFAAGQNVDIDLLTNSFKIHGSAANAGRLEVLGSLQISSGIPGLNKVLTSDASGLATWETPLAAFFELADTPSSFVGQAGKVVQVDVGEVGLEFGQLLRTTDSPTFNGLVLTGDLTVQGTTVTLDTTTLLVEDKNIELGNVAVPTDSTADGGGITLLAGVDGDKTILWTSLTNSWDFNQKVIAQVGLQVIGDLDNFGPGGVTSNFAAGTGALGSLTTGRFNVAVGVGALPTLTVGDHNIAIGHGVLRDHIGQDTIAIGFEAMLNNTVGNFNTAVGHKAFTVNFTGSGNTAIGSRAAQQMFNADNNTAVGADAMSAGFGAGGDNVAVGTGALKNVDTGSRNVGVGALALTLATNAKSNVAVGFNALALDISGDFNVALGEGALQSLTVADDNIAVGFAALQNVTTGIDNIGIGCFVGEGIVTGSRNILIGEEANFATDVSDMLNIGNSMFLSMATSNFLGLGIPSPTSSIHIQRAGQTEIALETYSAVNSIPVLSFKRSDGATVGAHAAVDAGDILGLIDFYGSNGTIFLSSAQMLATAEETFTATSAATSLRLFTTPVGSVIPLERMAITPSGNLELAGQIKITGGSPGINKVLTSSDANGLATWAEDLGTVVAQETFASTNVRFFGELALPTAQGWTDVATGSATIDLQTQLVFGVSKQVVRHNDDFTNGSTTSSISLTSQNWTDINAFGAVYSGTSRLDTTDGAGGFFSGLQANTAENPLATGNRRYGILFANDVGNLKVTEPDAGTTVTFDGTGGNPLILFDEWFSWECVVPAGLGAAQFFINGILTTFAPTFRTNAGGLGTKIIVSSGSTSGSNRITYHGNFGVTIFEDSATKTLASATMDADVAQVNIPEGRRDYTIILPDGNPRELGSVFRVVANNLFGKITLENQNPAAPEILYNGLRTLVIDVFVKELIGGINTVDQGNVYLGFKDEDIDRAESIFAQLSSSVDQIPVDTNPTVITYNTQDEINGIGHSTSLNPGELEILPGSGGVYSVVPQPQVGKDTGGVKADLDTFWQIDRGSGFVDEANSNVKITIKDFDITDVIVSAFMIKLNAGDKIRMMQRASSSTVGLGLKSTAAEVGPPTVPSTPSVILAVARIGGI